MELRQLEYFAAVARHKHFTRAAEALYVTQPALSQQIRRLEAELGLALLRRTSRGVELTAAGEDLLVHAEAVLAEVARRGRTWIATPASRAASCAWPRPPPTRRGCRRRWRTSTATIRDPDRAAAGLGGGARRAGRGGGGRRRRAGADDEPAGVTRPPARGGAAARGGPGRRRARRPAVALDALRGRPFILAEPGTALRETVMRAAQAGRVQPAAAVRGRRPPTVRFLVRAGLGVSLVPASWLERPGPVVGAADLRDPPRHRLSLLTPAAGSSPAGRLLRERLLEL